MKLSSNTSPRERFNLQHMPVTETGCWLWTGATSRGFGYGCIGVKGKNWQAHRFSWELHRGEIPPGLQVLHKCDTPACVNPDHLFLGDPAVNCADKIAKGRLGTPRGEAHGKCKLTDAQVRAIREDPRGSSAIATDYGVTRGHIRLILRRRYRAMLSAAHGGEDAK